MMPGNKPAIVVVPPIPPELRLVLAEHFELIILPIERSWIACPTCA